AVDGRWTAEPMSEQAFRSRLHVVRPDDPATFNGTVIVVWNNVSAGQDKFLFGPAASRLLDDGFALVGVTAQQVGVDGLGAAAGSERTEYFGTAVEWPPGLRDVDPERYGDLVHPGDGYYYDIFSQAAALLRVTRPGDFEPLAGLAVRRLVAMGGSQSANRLATYYNAVQPLASPFDAFLLLVYAGCPSALDPTTAPSTL